MNLSNTAENLSYIVGNLRKEIEEEFSSKKVISFPVKPTFKLEDFSDNFLEEKSKKETLIEAYISDRTKISNRKSIDLMTRKYSNLPAVPLDNSFSVVFEKIRGFETLPNLREKELGKFLEEIGEKTSRSVRGLENRSIKVGFPVGIMFEEKYNSNANLEEECGVLIEVYNSSQPIEIYRIDENGKSHRAVLNSGRMKREYQPNSRKFTNVYTVKCKASDLKNYIFSANVKSITRVEKKRALLN